MPDLIPKSHLLFLGVDGLLPKGDDGGSAVAVEKVGEIRFNPFPREDRSGRRRARSAHANGGALLVLVFPHNVSGAGAFRKTKKKFGKCGLATAVVPVHNCAAACGKIVRPEIFVQGPPRIFEVKFTKHAQTLAATHDGSAVIRTSLQKKYGEGSHYGQGGMC
jgi:hypothetical protein